MTADDDSTATYITKVSNKMLNINLVAMLYLPLDVLQILTVLA